MRFLSKVKIGNLRGRYNTMHEIYRTPYFMARYTVSMLLSQRIISFNVHFYIFLHIILVIYIFSGCFQSSRKCYSHWNCSFFSCGFCFESRLLERSHLFRHDTHFPSSDRVCLRHPEKSQSGSYCRQGYGHGCLSQSIIIIATFQFSNILIFFSIYVCFFRNLEMVFWSTSVTCWGMKLSFVALTLVDV